MPAETIVVLAVVCAMFGAFMIVLASVWIWTNLPERATAKAAPAQAKAVASDYRKAA